MRVAMIGTGYVGLVSGACFSQFVREADAVFIAVGTPSRRGEGDADLSFVFGAASEIAEAMNGYTLVVTKSTVPVGTGQRLKAHIRELRPDADFDIASNPALSQ